MCCSNVLPGRDTEDLEVYSCCSTRMQRKHLESNMTYPSWHPCSWRCWPCSSRCPAELAVTLGSAVCDMRDLTKRRNVKKQKEGLRGTRNWLPVWGWLWAKYGSEHVVTLEKTISAISASDTKLRVIKSRSAERRMLKPTADFYHVVYVCVHQLKSNNDVSRRLLIPSIRYCNAITLRTLKYHAAVLLFGLPCCSTKWRWWRERNIQYFHIRF